VALLGWVLSKASEPEDHEPCSSLREVRRDAAATVFNQPDYRVVDAVDLPAGGRRVRVEATSRPGCPVCGVLATRCTRGD